MNNKKSYQSALCTRCFGIAWTATKRLAVLSVLVFPVLICGCEPKTESQYKTLSFFFDGVPDPARRAAEELRKEQEKEESGKKQVKRVQAQHAPFAAKQCDGCHRKSTNALVLPIDQLCFRCHSLDTSKKYTHGPVASGGCRICHSPHGSGFPFLLVAKPEEFCFYCHDKKSVSRNEKHAGLTEECTACHEAHSSDDRYLLR